MELAFEKKTLRQLCESEAEAKRALGPIVAEKLKHRVADLLAASRVTDLVAGRPHEIKGPNHQNFVVELSQGSCIVFCANHNSIPTLESGAVDWSKVSRIKILQIGQDHD